MRDEMFEPVTLDTFAFPSGSKARRRMVVCAAVRSLSGKIVAGPRHWDRVMRDQILMDGKIPPGWLSAQQGFIDQQGQFMDRKEAWVVAEEAGQIRHRLGHSEGTLYSENLY